MTSYKIDPKNQLMLFFGLRNIITHCRVTYHDKGQLKHWIIPRRFQILIARKINFNLFWSFWILGFEIKRKFMKKISF